MRLTLTEAGDGPPLVMLPGWAMHGAVWGAFAGHLAAHFRLLQPDWPDDCDADEADALIASLADLAPRAWWLGWSLGGQLALQVARRFPRRVAGLVLVATNPRFLAAPDWPGMAPAAFAELERRVHRDPQRALRRFLGLAGMGGDGRLLRRLWALRPPPGPAVLRAGLVWLRDWDLRATLTGLRCPSLWLGGAGDVLVPADALAAAARLAGGRRMTVAGGGHVPFLTAPAAVAAAVRDVHRELG